MDGFSSGWGAGDMLLPACVAAVAATATAATDGGGAATAATTTAAIVALWQWRYHHLQLHRVTGAGAGSPVHACTSARLQGRGTWIEAMRSRSVNGCTQAT